MAKKMQTRGSERFFDGIKFNRQKTIKLSMSEFAVELPLIAGWTTARLVGWAFFGQRDSQRIAKEDRTGAAAERPFDTKNAEKAGQLFLAHRLYRYIQSLDGREDGANLSAREAALAAQIYFENGSRKRSFGHAGRSIATLHNDFKVARDLKYVYLVMKFLVRAKLFERADLNSAERARNFVNLDDQCDPDLSVSKIEKKWNRYRDVAPLIYVFYPFMYPVDPFDDDFSKHKVSETEWVGRIVQIATKLNDEYLRYAAYAVEALSETKIQKKELDIFKGMIPLAPVEAPFSEIEEAIIASFDREARLQN